MNSAVLTFDTLSAARRLREKGMPQEQAEAVADELRLAAQLDISHLSTKEEMAVFKSDLKEDLANFATKAELKAEIQALELKLQNMELRITVRLGAMIFALGGALIAIKYFG